MSDDARHIIEEALRLPIKDRAMVVSELLASMHGEPDADVEAAWAEEIERRSRRVLEEGSQGKDWATVRVEIEANRRRR